MVKNIIRDLIPISEEYNDNLMAVIKKYVSYVENGGIGEIPDVLTFDKDALEKTKQFYLKEFQK